MLKGVFISFLSYAVFSCGDACVKALGGRLSVFEIGFFTMLVACFAIPFSRRPGERWRDIFRMNRPGLVMLRTVAGVVAAVLSVFSFTHLPLAEVYSLMFLAPLLVTILSIPFLGERIGWRRSIAAIVGFAGVLLVVRPGFREVVPAHFAAAAVALCGAVTVLSLRALGPTEKRVTLIGVVLLSSLTFNGAVMLRDFRVPEPGETLLIVLAGLCAGTGQMLLVAATRAVPANRVAPAQYSQIAWAVLLGAIFFDEVPDAIACAGIALVTFAGLFTFVREEARGGRFPAVWTIVWTGRRRGAPSGEAEASRVEPSTAPLPARPLD